jgi:hypothetical protein
MSIGSSRPRIPEARYLASIGNGVIHRNSIPFVFLDSDSMHTCHCSVVDNAHLRSGGTVGYASYASCLAFRLSHSTSKAGNDPLVTTGLGAALAVYPSLN